MTLLVAVGMAWVLSGCASMRPLQSTPPASAFSLPAPFTVHYVLGSETILPAGRYVPAFEDDRGYYYQAPAKIIGNSTAVWLWEGGLFIPKGADTPDRYYTIGKNNVVSLHKLGRTLAVEKTP